MLTMTLNAEVSVGGSVSMAVLGAQSGLPVPGFGHGDAEPIYGNRLAAPLRFHRDGQTPSNNLTLPAQQQVRLEFKLQPPAQLFAWEFHCS